MSTEQGVIPMLAYEDGIAAMAWLERAFGFRERMRLVEPDGRLSHGELETGAGTIMLASPTPDYQGPARHRENCAAARAWSEVPWIINGVLVYVENVDAHFQRAREAGARVLSEPADAPPGRLYRVEDLEGHRWMFMQRSQQEA